MRLADGYNTNVNKSRDELKSSSHNITINLTKFQENKLSSQTPITILHTAIADVNGQKLKLLLDAGADASVTLKKCYEKLGLRPKEANKVLTIRTMNGHKSSSSKYVEVNLGKDIKIKTFAIAQDYNIDQQKFDLLKIWPTLDKTLAKEVKENTTAGGIDMIIGLDHLYGTISNTRHILHPEKKLALMHTVFGFSIGGTTASRDDSSSEQEAIQILNSSFQVEKEPTKHNDTEREIQENMNILFETEADVNQLDVGKDHKSEDERYAMEEFKKHLTFKNGMYWVKPLFKKPPDYTPLLNNYNIAEKNYQSLRRRLAKDKSLEEQYKAEINKLIHKGDIEEVSENQLEASDPKRHINYLPQIVVQRQEKVTSKVRPVFNASSKNNQNVSLNDNILCGPKTQESINKLSILMRLKPIVVLADLQKMFHSIGYLEEPDVQTKLENNRDVFRILWSDDPDDHPKVYRWVKVVFGVASSPFLANAVVEHHLRRLVEDSKDEEEVEAAELLLRSMYVDDVLAAVENVDKAIKMASMISKIFKDMGMKATKYASNNSEVLATIPHEDLAPTTQKELPSKPGSTELISKTTKVVGMVYEPEKDVFTFKPYAKLLDKPVPMTKRGVSSIIPSIYDISGHIAPYILKGKSILSRIWAYEKPNGSNIEEETRDEKADILLAQFKENDPVPDEIPDLCDSSDSEDDETDHFKDFKEKYGYGSSEHPKEPSKVEESVKHSETINILNVQVKESGATTTSKPTSKSDKVVSKKFVTSIPSKKASKTKVEKLGWDTPLPPELESEFQEWLNELKLISEYSFERYVFGSTNGKYSNPPDKNSWELHVFVDGGNSGYGISIFWRFQGKKGYKMVRIFACSRVIGPNSSLSVPRRELCGILLGIKKVVALAKELEIPKNNIFCHTDSLINMYWIKKNPGDLTVYVANRVRQIQDSRIPIFYVESNNNPSDNVSKIKSVKQYLNTDLWNYGPSYMSESKWYVGRSIEEIKEEKSPNPTLSEEIAKEMRKSAQDVHINLTQMKQTPLNQNIISFAQLKTNDLQKIKRILLYCFKFLANKFPAKFSNSNGKMETLKGGGSCENKENSPNPKFYWAPFQRHWYVARKAGKNDEIPAKLKNKRRDDQTIVKFLGDQTYSTLPTTKLEPIGKKEVDQKRAKRDSKGYAEMEAILTANSKSHPNVSEVENNESRDKDAKESSKPNSAITPLVGKITLKTDYDADELEAVLNAMILNDQKLTFVDEYKALQNGEPVNKSSSIATLAPFLDEDGLIKMRSRLEYCDSLPEQARYPTILDHPSKSKLAELLIKDVHLSGYHSGPEFTRRTLRNRYWIVGGKKAIQSILHKCCHKACRPIKTVIQNIPPLPAERMNTAKVFEMISLDGIGPFEIKKCGICNYKSLCEKCYSKLSIPAKKSYEKERHCKTRKCWISLIVCMVSRCVSLELVLDKTCESFLMSFQRHCSENGIPRYILSDNDAAYIRANEEIQTLFRSDVAKKHYATNGIRWNFTPRRSPQHNGVTESLVAICRKTLRGIFGATKMTEQEFTTALKLAQMKINSRPLIGVSDDPNDQNLLTITPFHLKMCKPVALFPSSLDDFTANDLDKMKLSIRDRWQQRKILQAQFFLKWKNEYLMSQEKIRNDRYKENKVVNVGDIVLVMNNKTTKDSWPIARVTKIFKSNDGVIRSVELRLPINVTTKEKTTNFAKRSASKPDITYEYKNPRITTRGVEHIAILESVDSQQENSHDVEGTYLDGSKSVANQQQ